jgi:hypothetical protein
VGAFRALADDFSKQCGLAGIKVRRLGPPSCWYIGYLAFAVGTAYLYKQGLGLIWDERRGKEKRHRQHYSTTPLVFCLAAHLVFSGLLVSWYLYIVCYKMCNASYVIRRDEASKEKLAISFNRLKVNESWMREIMRRFSCC